MNETTLEREVAALKKVNRVLMERVENSVNSSGNDYSIFERNILLEKLVEERTRELELANKKLTVLLNEQKKTTEHLKHREVQQEIQRNVLTKLLHDTSISEENLINVLKTVASIIADTLDVHRAGIWQFSRETDELICLIQYDEKDIQETNTVLRISDFPEYFSTIKNTGTVIASDARKHPATAAFTESYFKPYEIFSLMDTGIIIEGRLQGVICVEQKKTIRTWHPDEESFLRTVSAIIGQVMLNIDRRQALEDLNYSNIQISKEQNFNQLLLDTSPALIVMLDSKAQILMVNKAMMNLMGLSQEELKDKNFFDHIINTTHDYSTEKLISTAEFSTKIQFEGSIRTASSSSIIVEWHFKSMNTGERILFIGAGIDITEKKTADIEKEKLQGQLHQAMKMEAVGRLAGGIAHDFNNLLTSITGNVEYALLDLSIEDPLTECLLEIKHSAESAADLTRQLLAFSRRQMIEPRVLDLNDLIFSLHRMLVRIIGEDVKLSTIQGENLDSVKIDPGQFEQILVNLAINARDAMPSGGNLIIETSNKYLDESYCAKHTGVTPGSYVMLAVSDTGSGISEEIKKHIFEPFFTTKPKGKGTGLGLATIYGIVSQSGGTIEVYSEIKKGTSFKIYFPAIMEKPEKIQRQGAIKALPGGKETILLVEDDKSVRDLAAKVIRKLGYHVLEACDGQNAFMVSQMYGGKIHLLFTDIIMPGMNGKQLGERMKKIIPDLKILYTSGYTENAIAHHGVIDQNINFLSKPYTPSSLAEKIRNTLDNQI